METSFLELKQKQVVNICDGKQLGRVCDVVFSFPDGKVQGIVVPGGKGFRWGKADLFVELKNVTKIGVDTVLVEIKAAPSKDKKKNKWSGEYPAPPPPPAQLPEPPPFYRGSGGGGQRSMGDRRDYGEYE